MTNTEKIKVDKNIVEFTCVPEVEVYNGETYKVYGVFVDINKYPNLQLNKYGNVTICGDFHTLGLGIKYQVKAIAEVNQYGVSYKVQNIRRDRPTTLEATRSFLHEILTPAQAEEILREYPNIVDKVINNDLEDIDLSKLYNIGEYRFNIIKEKIIDNFALVDLVDRFQGTLSLSIIKALYLKYPSIEKVMIEMKKDPYNCLCAINRVGFKTADSILNEIDRISKENIANGKEPIIDFGYDLKTSKQRCKACVMYLLRENETQGNTYIDIVELKEQSAKLAPACKQHFVDVIKDSPEIYFNKDIMGVALSYTYEMEKYIAQKIYEAKELDKQGNNQWELSDVEKYRKIDGFDLSDEQMQTLPNVCQHTITILNGSAGAGKSSSTLAVINMLKDLKKTCLLLAPTGRASKILSEYTKQPASTIHRGLGFDGAWRYNEDNKLVYDIVIVDEFSMCDVNLFYRLLCAIDLKKTKLLLIGDSSQLPSVGAGNCLHDLLSTNVVKSNVLTKTFRFGKGGVLTVATKIRKQERFIADNQKPTVIGEDKGYTFIPTDQTQVIDRVKHLYKKLIESGTKPEDIMVLSAYNKGEYGTVALNNALQPIANKYCGSDKKLVVGDTIFYLDDLVMQCVNNYKAKLYNEKYGASGEETFIPNGELGKVIDIKKYFNNHHLIIDFDNDEVIYDREKANMLKLAYSIGIHKSQGGSCDTVIMITPKAHTYMLNSNLMYVGVTRAKRRCFHFGEPNTINLALKKKENFNRKTMLKYFLSN